MSVDVKLWQSRINDDAAYQATFHPMWKQSLDLYSMNFWKKRGTSNIDDSVVSVNFATTFVKRLIQATYARNPKIKFQARQAEYVDFSATLEDTEAFLWDAKDLKNLIIRIYRDAIIFGLGWAELGWTKTFAEQATTRPDEPQKFMDRVKSILNPKPPESPKDGAEQGVLHELVKEGDLFVIRRHPKDVRLPAGFHDYYEMPYLTVHEKIRREDFLVNPIYKNKDEAGQAVPLKKPGSFLTTPSNTFTAKSRFPGNVEGQYVDLDHVWDKVNQRHYVLSSSSVEHLDEPWEYWNDGFPQIPLSFNEVPEGMDESNSYPFGDLEPMLPQLIEKSQLRTQGVAHRKRSNTVVFVQKGSSTESELRNYSESAAMTVIPVSNIQSIQTGPELKIPSAIFQMESVIDADLERESGLQLLLAQSGRASKYKTATLAKEVSAGASLESGFRVERLEDFSNRIAFYMAGLLWQFADKEYIANILGTYPSESQWPELPADEEKAKRIVRQQIFSRVDPGSTRPSTDETVEREQWIRATVVLQQTAPDIFEKIKRPYIKQFLKKMGAKDLEHLVTNAISEQSGEAAMKENQLLAENIPQVVDPNNDHEAHIKVHSQVKTQAGDRHLLEHAQMWKASQAQEKMSQHSADQKGQAPSSREVNRMGTPAHSDLVGGAKNMRKGTGPETP